jgi:hypothetical protein
MTLLEQFEKHLKETGRPQRYVARATNISEERLSAWRHGKYTGNVSKIENAVQVYLDRERQKVAAGRKRTPFIQTTVARRLFEVARTCNIDEDIGVATTPAGHGKTYAVQEYHRMYPETILVEADQGYTAFALFSMLHKLLCSHTGKESLHDMVENVIERLKNSGRLIIVDEAENLPTKALDLLRRVHDKAGVGILLVGLPRLEANLRGHRGEFAQLHSRVGIYAKLGEITKDDAKQLVNSMVPGANGICDHMYKVARKNARSLVLLSKRARRIQQINKAEQLDEDIVSAASQMLMV